jgi:hypothetical protein
MIHPATDIVSVVDHENNGIESVAIITVYACPMVMLYGENSDEIRELRNFRDDFLSKTPVGQDLIKLYYQWSPTIIRTMEIDENFKQQVKDMIDEFLEQIK